MNSFGASSPVSNQLQQQPSMYNGRVDISQPLKGSMKPYAMFHDQTKPQNNTTARQESVGYFLQSNRLQELFFSSQNIEILQKLIQYHVAEQSQGRFHIGRQDDFQLRTVMKSIYLSDGKNLPYNYEGQVKDLNKRVVEYCIPNILSNIQQHQMYTRDISTLPTPMELPKYTSFAGTRTNPNVNIF